MQTELEQVKNSRRRRRRLLSRAPRFRAGLLDRHGKPFRSNPDRRSHQRRHHLIHPTRA